MNVGATRQLIGEFGGQFYTSSSGAWNGDWFKVVAISSAVVTLTTANMSPSPLAVSLVQGHEIRGRFASITVTSGTVVAYNSKAGSVAWQTTTTKAGFVSTDYLDWSAFGIASQTQVSQGSTSLTNLGNQVDFSYQNTIGNTISVPYIFIEGTTGNSNFTTGEYALYSAFNEVLKIKLKSPVKSIGCQIQRMFAGGYIGMMSCFDVTDGLIGSVSTSGTYASPYGTGTAPFAGIIVSNPVISTVSFELTSPSSGNRILINRLLIV